jgi:hypothetical protein
MFIVLDIKQNSNLGAKTMKFFQSIKNLATAATIALTICLGSAVGAKAEVSQPPAPVEKIENTTIIDKSPTVVPPNSSNTNNSSSGYNIPNNQYNSSAYNSPNYGSQYGNQNLGYTNSSSSFNSNNTCGTQINAKAGGNPYNQIVDWSVGFTINLNNPCQNQQPSKSEVLNCQQQRFNGLQLILSTIGKDQKTTKPMSASEIGKYLDLICTIT